jgi:hypothetical protein
MENLHRTQIPHDVIMEYLQLYKSIGNNRHNHELFEADFDVMVRRTVRSNTYFFAKFFDIDISDARFKSLIDKGVKPKNKEELLLRNIHNAFTKIHDETSSFELLVSEIQDLLRFLYGDILPQQTMQYRKFKADSRHATLLTSKQGSTRESLERIVHLFKRALEHPEFEISYVALNFYIDFLHIKPFYEKNEEVALMLLYILLLANGYEVFEYIPFFEELAERKEQFEEAVIQASFNWELGYAQVLPLHQMILHLAIEAYDNLDYLVRDYQFDKRLNKSDNVENTINKLEDVFSKDDIRTQHPYISDSTINRTLKRLRDEKKIRPLGKGRSAKWIKLVPTKKKKFTQLDLDL